jgi:hypothetical protein
MQNIANIFYKKIVKLIKNIKILNPIHKDIIKEMNVNLNKLNSYLDLFIN